MKRMKLLFLPAVAALVFMSMNNPGKILHPLGLTNESANASIIANLTGAEGLSLPNLKIAPEILSGDKTGAAREVNQVASEFAGQWLAAGILTGQPGIVTVANPQTEAKTQYNSEEAKTSSEGNGQVEKKETPVSKAKGMIKSWKDKVIRIP